MINKTLTAALTALTLAGAVAATTSQAQAQSNPIELGAAVVGGALFAGAAVVGAVAGAPYYYAPYGYAGYAGTWCHLENRFDKRGFYVRTDRVCY